MTDLFPADMEGNTVIENQVELPNPCLAPVVFITNPQGSWFAMTDQTAETPTPPIIAPAMGGIAH
jgi:hypothetical protein